jgi:hypothetical protein
MGNDNYTDNLYEVAATQGGYFTAGQAAEAGFSPKNHAYYLKAGAWIREWRGIYRLARFPEPDDGQYVLWSLWTRNRKGVPQGVYSHETALAIFELSDTNPARLHMTVPPGFRKTAPTPPLLVLHKRTIVPGSFEQRAGYNVIKPLPNMLMLIDEDETPEEVLVQALRDGIAKGYFIESRLRQLDISKKVKTALERILDLVQ